MKMEKNDHVLQKALLSTDVLRKTIDEMIFEFETTEEVPALTNIIGQKRGTEVMQFGLQVNKPGYNLYVAGIPGTGKMTFTNSIVEEVANKEVTLFDWCYVNNFEDPYKPKVLQLPVGTGNALKADMEQLIDNLKVDIPRAFGEETYQREKASIFREFKEKTSAVIQEINDEAKQYGFVIRQSASGLLTIPTEDGKPMTEEAYATLDEETLQEMERKSSELQDKVIDYTKKLRQIEKDARETLETIDEKVVLAAVGYHMDELKQTYKSCKDVQQYLEAVLQDILKHRASFLEKEPSEEENNSVARLFPKRPNEDIKMRYAVNLLVDNGETKGAPIIMADNPTFYHLLGKVEYESQMGVMSTNFTKIKKGYLHEANGGYVIIQAKDILSKPYAWAALKRTLLTEQIQIEHMNEQAGFVSTTTLNPAPIPLHVKIILIGNRELYQLLYTQDEDFRKLFKIKADFDVEMDATMENMTKLASFIHTHCKRHNLLPFHRSAVARLVEYSSRLAGHQQKLSTRFNDQVEIMYEADTWARLAHDDLITNEHIRKAIHEREYRNSLYEEKVQQSIDEGVILIDTTGEKVGQVNGLAVYNVGQHSFGKPSRITATTFLGRKGIVNIERESELSGNVHNKGVYILSGYLGEKFAQTYPLALTAHITFEQNYGGVDGDSASSTELYAILSSLSEVPIKQGIAVTGSVNQKGAIQPIGGVNEKIEGFFETCQKRGLTGEQGVLIPHQNVTHLMLREEVVDAVADGTFHIYAVETIEQGMEILTGVKAVVYEEDGSFSSDCIYGKVMAKLETYAKAVKEETNF